MLHQLLPLLSRQDCQFVSLQYGEADAEIMEVNERLSDAITAFPSADYADFGQLAGMVKSVDLVVSVQTALIHLCGALGVPCLVMVPFMAEWRYGTAGDSMPWYNSVRLLRQPEAGAWGPVIEEVERAIETWPRP
jgi:ADP-heptose:LPS heptosyltransferase